MNNQNNSSNITFFERLVLFLIFSIIPFHFLLRAYIKGGLSWSGINFINIVSITYSVILLIVLIFQLIIKKPYLALIFGCHQKHDRSFSITNKYLNLCSRCSGILIGVFIMSFLSKLEINHLYFLIGIIPLLIDGLIQRFTKFKSTNLRRIITGIIFGPALIVIASYYYLFVSKLIIRLAEVF